MATLEEAIDALNARDKRKAQQTLARIIKQNPNDEKAWLWLGAVADSDEQRRLCLERVLQINPGNEPAQKGLMYLQKTQARSQGAATDQRPPKTVETDQSPSSSVVTPTASLSLPEHAPAPTQETKRPQHGFTHQTGNSIQKNLDRLGQTQATKWLSDQVNRQTGTVLSNSAGAILLLVVAGGILLASCITGSAFVLFVGFVIDREATGSLLQQVVYFFLGLFAIVVSCLLLLLAMRWIRGKWRQRTTSPFLPSLASSAQKLAHTHRQKPTNSKPRPAMPIRSSTPTRPQSKGAHSGAEPYPQRGFTFSEQPRAGSAPIPVKNVSQARTIGGKDRNTNVEQLIVDVNNKSYETRWQAIRSIRELQLRAAAPAVFKALKKLGRQKCEDYPKEAAFFLETLGEIGNDTIAENLYRLGRGGLIFIEHTSFLAYMNTLNKLGRSDLAIKILTKRVNPKFYNKGCGVNLRFVLAAGEVAISVGPGTAASLVCENIEREKKLWKPGLSWGYLLSFSDPVSLLVSGGLSLAATVASNVIRHSVLTNEGQQAASLMVSSDMVESAAFQELPEQAKMTIALHCYSTALASISKGDLSPVRAQLVNRQKPIEQAVISLALAQSGDASVKNVLERLCGNSDWVVRLLAYEGLIMLAAISAQPPTASQLMGLQDRDVRVKVSVASIMASTKNPVYHPHILTLANSNDEKSLQAVLPVIARLAQNGNQPARSKLVELAQRHSSRDIRKAAQGHLTGLSE